MFYAVRARETHAETVLTFLAASACAAFPWMSWTLEKKKKSFQELSCCGDCDVFVFVVVFLHLACQRSLLITLPFIRAGGLSRSTWEQGQDGETVASQAIENALALPAGAAQLSDPDADVHRQHLLGLFRVSPDTILRLAAEWERAQIMTEGGRLRIVPVSLGSNGHKCKVWQLGGHICICVGHDFNNSTAQKANKTHLRVSFKVETCCSLPKLSCHNCVRLLKKKKRV